MTDGGATSIYAPRTGRGSARAGGELRRCAGQTGNCGRAGETRASEGSRCRGVGGQAAAAPRRIRRGARRSGSFHERSSLPAAAREQVPESRPRDSRGDRWLRRHWRPGLQRQLPARRSVTSCCGSSRSAWSGSSSTRRCAAASRPRPAKRHSTRCASGPGSAWVCSHSMCFGASQSDSRLAAEVGGVAIALLLLSGLPYRGLLLLAVGVLAVVIWTRQES